MLFLSLYRPSTHSSRSWSMYIKYSRGLEARASRAPRVRVFCPLALLYGLHLHDNVTYGSRYSPQIGRRSLSIFLCPQRLSTCLRFLDETG